MIEVILDASLSAIPNAALSKDEAEDIIFRIQEVSEWMTEGHPVRFSAHSNFDGYLANLYPDLESITEFLQLTDLCHTYSSRDIYNIYTDVIQRIVRLDRGDIGEVAHFDSMDLDADLTFVQPDLLARAFELSLVTAAFRRASGLATVVSSPAPWRLRGACNVSASSVCTRSGDGDYIKSVGGVSDEICIIASVNDIFTQSLAEETWKAARNTCGIYSAIWVGCGAYAAANHKACPPEVAFKIGENFYETAADNQCAVNGRFSSTALKTCVYYLYDSAVVAKRPFMGVARRAHDDAQACRSHITKGNPALRLLTWDSPVGYVEFANIGLKKQLQIYAGRHGSAYP